PQQAPDEDVARYAHIPDKKRRIYAAMVDVMDRGIGDVVAALEKHGIRENTLLFFLSDNGGPQSSPGKPTNWNGSSNTPFRGGKGNMYDGDTNAERGPGYESDVNRDCVLVWVGCFGQVAH
ncbi:MAG: sulfatase-like hydrolase/transferase, partial [Alphaproteobacteria bacterium]|nr:sulfatase-like hydrolase/transferase [Alphaproteobacteria bacterium]